MADPYSTMLQGLNPSGASSPGSGSSDIGSALAGSQQAREADISVRADSIAALMPGAGLSITEAAQQRVDEAARVNEFILGAGDPERLGMAVQEGNDLGSSPLAQELAFGDLNVIRTRYGPQAEAYARQVQTTMRRNEEMLNRSRSTGEFLQDSAAGIGAVTARSLGGIAGVLTGIVNDDAGAAVAEFAQGADEYIREFQSPQTTEQRRQQGVRRQLDREDIQRDYEADLAAGASNPGLRRFGREAAATIQDFYENPTLAADVAVESIGSLIASGGIGRIVAGGLARATLMAQGASRASAARFLGSQAGKKFLGEMTVKTMPGTIGLLEGGGAYAQIQAEIQDMTEAEMADSPEYQELRAGGMTHEEARSRIANIAGLEGGAIQGVVGVLTGRLASRFEAGAVGAQVAGSGRQGAVGALTDLGENVLREATEEGLQGVSGELAAGSAIQRYADPDRDVGEGLGQAAVESVVAGAGMAGIVSAPRAGARVAGAGVSSALEARRDAVDAGLDRDSAVGSAAQQSAVDAMARAGQAAQSAAAARQGAATNPENNGNVDPTDIATPTATPNGEATEQVVPPTEQVTPPEQRIAEALLTTEAELNSAPPAVRKYTMQGATAEQVTEGLGGVPSRGQAILGSIEYLTQDSVSKSEKDELALWLFDQAAKIRAVKSEDISSLDPAFQADIQEGLSAVDTLLSNPGYEAALERARSVDLSQESVPDITAESITSPEVQDTVRKNVLVAKANPAGANAKVVDGILGVLDQKRPKKKTRAQKVAESQSPLAPPTGDQQSSGTQDQEGVSPASLGLSETDVKALRSAQAIMRAAATADTAKQAEMERLFTKAEAAQARKTGLGKIDQVRSQIMELGRNEKKQQFGLTRHFSNVNSAMAAGDMNVAQASFNVLGELVLNQGRKLRAGAESMKQNGKLVKYATWDGQQVISSKDDGANGISIKPNSKNSMFLAREMEIDYEVLSDAYSSLKTIYPELADELAANNRTIKPIQVDWQTGDLNEVSESSQSSKPPAGSPAGSLDGAQKVTLTPKTKFVAKDQKKADQATKFIGQGSARSSTAQYAKDFGKLANTGQYTKDDVVFISAEGQRQGRLAPDFVEIDAAMDAGATIITDVKADRNRAYNVGEQEVATFLENNGYVESKPGRWSPRKEGKNPTELLRGLARKANRKLRSKEPPIRLKTGLKEGAIATYSPSANIVRLDPVALAQDFQNGLTHLMGKGGKTAEQKAEVFKNIDVEAFQKHLLDSGVETYAEFILAHEQEHGRQIANGEKYPKDLMDPVAIDMERRANEAGYKAIGYEPVYQDTQDTSDEQGGEAAQVSADVSVLAKGPDGKSRIESTYTINPERSPIMDPENGSPLEQVVAQLEQSSNNKSIVAFLKKHVPLLVEGLNKHNQTIFPDSLFGDRKGERLTLVQAVQKEKDKAGVFYTGRVKGRAGAIINPETGLVDQRLAEAAAIGLLNWIMSGNTRGSMKAEDVANFFNISEDEVTSDHLRMVNEGVNIRLAKTAVSRQIQQFWGVERTGTVDMAQFVGITESLAAQLLEVAEGTLIESKTLQLKNLKGLAGDPISVGVKEKVGQWLEKQPAQARKSVEQILPERDMGYFFDNPLENRQKKQKRNILGFLSGNAKKAVAAHHDIVFKRVPAMHSVVQVMGKDFLLKFRGYKEIDPARTNVMDALSIMGKNQNLVRSYEVMEEMEFELDSYSDLVDKPKDEVDIYHGWSVRSQDRIMSEGPSGQNDKFLRALYTPAVSSLDLTKEKDLEFFWLSVAQALGISTEKQYRAQSITDAQNMVKGDLANAVSLVRKMLSGEALTEAEQDSMLADMKAAGLQETQSPDALAMVSLHALVQVARFQDAIEAGNTSDFQHMLSFEADGKTDGPFYAMLHFITGAFKVAHVKNLAKGGLFLNRFDRTLAQLMQTDKNDLYKEAATQAQKYVQKLHADLNRFDDFREVTFATMRVMDHLIGKDFNFDPETGKMEIGRGVLKNPVTIFMYGSGSRGMAAKLSAVLQEALYTKMTEALQEGTTSLVVPEGFMDDLKIMMTRRFRLKDGHLGLTERDFNGKEVRGSLPRSIEDLRTMEFDESEKFMMRENLRHLFIEPTIQAIDDVTGGTRKVTSKMQAGTQIQSALFLDVFKRAVQDKVKELIASGEVERGGFLTENQYNEIFKEMSKYGAVIETVYGSTQDSNHLNLSGKENARSWAEFSRSPSGKFRGESSLMMPKLIGVGATPQLNISRGDAKMMVNYFAADTQMGAERLKVLPVFDGLEISAHLIEVLSEAINKASAEAAMENPLRDVSDSFHDFLRQGIDLSNLDLSTWEFIIEALVRNDLIDVYEDGGFVELAKIELAHKGIEKPEKGVKAIQEYSEKLAAQIYESFGDKVLEEMKEIDSFLQNAADSVEARKAVMSQMPYSNDHMSGAEAPYNNTEGGKIWTDSNGNPLRDGPLVRRMNQLYKAELKKIQKRRSANKTRAAVPAATKEMRSAISQVAVAREGSIQELNSNALKAYFAAVKPGLAQEKILQGIMKILGQRQLKVFVGKPADLTKLRDEMYPELAETAADIELGQTVVGADTIFVSNPTPETILHELLHGVLADTFLKYFEIGPQTETSGLTKGQRAAIKNLLGLMDQVMGLDFSLTGETSGVLKAMKTMREEVLRHRNSGHPHGEAFALMEFVSWSLTNQNISETLKRSKARVPGGLKTVRFLQTKITEVISFLRNLVGIEKGTPLDVYNNILWNTSALLIEPYEAPGHNTLSGVLDQLNPNSQGNNTRLTGIMEQFENRVGAVLKGLASTPGLQTAAEQGMYDRADQAVNRVTAGGFDLSIQEQSAFRQIYAALTSGAAFNGQAMVELHKIYEQFLDQTKAEDFRDITDILQAQEMLKTLRGENDLVMIGDKSDQAAVFLALSLVHEPMREVLNGKKLPSKAPMSIKNPRSVDDFFNRLGETMMENLSREVMGLNSAKKGLKNNIEKLGQVLAVIEEDDRSTIKTVSDAMGSTVGRGDSFLKDRLLQAGDFLVEEGAKGSSQSRTRAGRIAVNSYRNAATLLGGMFTDKEYGKKNALRLVRRYTAETPLFMKPVNALIAEVIGMESSNKNVLGMMNKVRSVVSRVRQVAREHLPKIISEEFSRKITPAEWKHMFKGLGKSDLAVLGEYYHFRDIREFLTNPARVDAEINDLEAELQTLDPDRVDQIKSKSDALAEFMMNGRVENGNNGFLRNALAIALDLDITTIDRLDVSLLEDDSTAELESVLDRLVTMYAMQKLPQDTKDNLRSLAQDESRGVDMVMAYLIKLRGDENSKASSVAGRLNGYKGFIPSESKEGLSVIVAEDSQSNALMMQGYTRMGEYKGSGYENGTRSYWFSTVGGRSSYQQGIMQTVHQSRNGVDPLTGRTVGPTVGGHLGREEFLRIKRELKQGRSVPAGRQNEALMPIFNQWEDEQGNLYFDVVGYERYVDVDKLAGLKRSEELHQMIGAWEGRVLEERVGLTKNQELVKNLKTMWDKADTDERKAYVDVSDPEIADRTVRDAWKMIPRETKKFIEETFSDTNGKVMVRKDMIDNVLGYRMPSVAEIWKGESNLPEPVKETIQDVIKVVLGRRGYQTVVTAEKLMQTAVSAVKQTIVIRSVVVPAANLASNVVQLAGRGVSMPTVLKGYKSKLTEITQYQASLDEISKLQAERVVNSSNPAKVKAIDAKIQRIKDTNRRMSIWPMIEAGEYTTLSEGMNDMDMQNIHASLSEGRIAEYVGELAEKIPQRLGTAGRYGFLTQDTPIFKAMAASVQYGDFIAKSIYYDHQVKSGVDAETALNNTIEEYVAYNFLPGRTRSYLDSVGLTWFWPYKLRSMKVAHSLIRENPFRALMTLGGLSYFPNMPGISLGSPLTDNMLSVWLDERFKYGVGLGMLFRGPSLHPVYGWAM